MIQNDYDFLYAQRDAAFDAIIAWNHVSYYFIFYFYLQLILINASKI
jgi:hypothetical protein